ncbi:MAG TPA: ABC transporter permease [Vicinamibacterales bacterium]|nr:ABC transporter permease [Vicinamibacterales bacterium]
MRGTAFERRARALFAAVLHLYPASYRDEYGREMTLVLVDRLRAERSAAARVVALLAAVAAVVVDAPRQHAVVVAQDLRLALRLIGRERWFAAVAIGTVALGIGLSTAVFSVGKSLLVDALPYREADRAAMVWVTNPRQNRDRDVTSYPRLVAWRERSESIETFAAYSFRRAVVTGIADPEQLIVVRTTPELFRVVRSEPVVGRLFAATEEDAAVMVLGHGFWQRKFGGQPGAVGQTLRLDGVPYTIIGVLPPSFQFPARDMDAWVPLRPSREERESGAFWLEAVARLRFGVSLAQAQQEMTAIADRLGAERPDDRGLGVALVGLRDEIAGPFKPALALLTAAVLGVLAIACVNVAGMLTARGAARRREVAIRTALGASRRRVVRQLLTEAVVLFVLGGVLGVSLASVLLRLLVGIAPPTLAWLADVSLDGPMLAIALGTAALTGVFFGVLPSWRGAGADVVAVVASGVKGTGRGGLSQPFRWTLVASQIAIATVVVSSASLSLASLVHAQRIDLGFEPARVLTARLELPRAKYPDAPARQRFFDRLLERVRALPGVTGAAAGSTVLGRSSSSSFAIEGRAEWIQQPLTFDIVTPDFFQVLQVPLLRGRWFSDRDTAAAPPVAIINETTAKTHWPNEDPLGKRFTFGGDRWMTVVGIVADTRRYGVDQRVRTESYQPYTQSPGSMTLLVRTAGEPTAIVPALRTVVRDLDPEQPLARVGPLDSLIDNQTAARRFNTWLLGAFGAAAITLTAIGLYSLLAYVVALRRHEMAVRLAIGGTPAHVLRLIVRNVSWVVGIGIVVGLAAALAAAQWMRTLLFGIEPWDPFAQAITVGVLGAVAAAAAWIPARRAMSVDPAHVLRGE